MELDKSDNYWCNVKMSFGFISGPIFYFILISTQFKGFTDLKVEI